MSAIPMTIVLADDDDGHATLVEKNLLRAGLSNKLVRLRDGEEVMEYFGCNGTATSSAQQAVLLVLDVKMPRLDGKEVLRRLKSDPRFSRIPVIMLTTTDDPLEIEQCYQLGCNIYITKPVGYESFVEAVQRLGLFLEVVKVPDVEIASAKIESRV